jgi:hypothetical protein
MFEWYGRATRCFALLADILWSSNSEEKVKLSPSRRFSRGWTLHELIAPQEVNFYDQEWNHLGARSLKQDEIAECKGIAKGPLGRGYLHNFHPESEILDGRQRSDKRMPRSLNRYSVAQRMSWAAGRLTT